MQYWNVFKLYIINMVHRRLETYLHMMAAGKNGGGMVIARTGARRVQTIIPNQREWLSVLACVNAAGKAIPSFYIFRGRRFRQNYIQLCEPGATMAMQQRAWMTTSLFSA